MFFDIYRKGAIFMKWKKPIVSMLSMSMVLGTIAVPAYAQVEKPMAMEQDGVVPYDLEIKDGTEDNVVEFNYTVELSKGNGKYINFWINNTGNKDIAITINNKAEKVIKPGKQGHTYIEASTFAKDYVFKAVPSGAGGRISFDYRIAQRDKIVP